MEEGSLNRGLCAAPPQDGFRRRKWLLALAILGAGMAAAVLWHGFQRWGLHRGYPYNTFLFVGRSRFGDLSAVFKEAALPNPYRRELTAYFPFTYRFFSWLHLNLIGRKAAMAAFAGPIALGLAFLAAAALRPVLEGKALKARMTAGLGFLFLLYPFWFCIDRGNIELLLVLLVAASVYLLALHRHRAALACLVPAICFKLYPAVLLALYLRRGRVRWIGIGLAAVLALSWASLISFEGPWRETWSMFQGHLAEVGRIYAIDNHGLAGSATPWNAYKAVLGFVHCPTVHGTWDWAALPDRVLHLHQRIYSFVMLGGAVAVTGYVCLVETAFLRRAVLLLLYMVMASPIGQDYKLLHVGTALLALILVPERRRHDLLAVGLLAFALVPKKEVFLPLLGITDTLTADVPIGIFLTPLAMLGAAGLLVWDGCAQWSPRWGRQRLRNLLSVLRPIGKYPKRVARAE